MHKHDAALFFDVRPPMSESGSVSDLGARSCEVRFTWMSRHREFDRLRAKRRSTARASRACRYHPDPIKAIERKSLLANQ
jgi:hypothetical protein